MCVTERDRDNETEMNKQVKLFKQIKALCGGGEKVLFATSTDLCVYVYHCASVYTSVCVCLCVCWPLSCHVTARAKSSFTTIHIAVDTSSS